MHERVLARAGELLGSAVSEPEELGGSDRSTVLRVRSTLAAHPTAVLKWFAVGDATNSGGYGYVREHSGLATIPRTPELLAADHELALLIMADVGSGPGLAEALLGDDPDLAWVRCDEWARALGELCAGSGQHVEDFRAGIAALDPDTRSRGGMPSPRLPHEALLRLRGVGFPAPGDLAEELAVLEQLVDPAPRDAVVTPGDFCPDNVIFTEHGPRFVDLEGASVHHLALDAAYAWMPFGTCWCLFDAPAGFTAHLMAAFEETVRPTMAATLDDPAWNRMLQAAGAQTVLTMTELSWDAAVRDRSADPGGTTSRQRLAARWRWAAEALTELPLLREGFAIAADWAARTWSPDWPLYPAFRAAAPR